MWRFVYTSANNSIAWQGQSFTICDRAVDLKPSAGRSSELPNLVVSQSATAVMHFSLANPEVNITMVPLDKKPVGIVPFANTGLLNTLKHVVQQGNLHR